MKLLIINNLASGYREGSIYDFVRAIAKDGDEICIRSTDGTSDLTTFLDDAHHFDLVVASGGDGTISAVCHRLAYSGIPILPFPAGTANLLTMNLRSASETHALAQQARDGVVREFDLAELCVDGKTYGFSLIAGAGYDATIMKDAKQNKDVLGPIAYFSAALTNPTPQYSTIRIETDDGTRIEPKGVGLLIANFSKIQFEVPIAHESDPQDGLLELIILKSETAFGLIPALGAALLDRDGEYPNRTNSVEIIQCKQAHINANPPLPIQFDGDAIESTTPFSIRVLPKAAKILVSKEATELYN